MKMPRPRVSYELLRIKGHQYKLNQEAAVCKQIA